MTRVKEYVNLALANQLFEVGEEFVAWNSQQHWPMEVPILRFTLQPLYKTVRYKTVLDITRFKDGSQKCIGYI